MAKTTAKKHESAQKRRGRPRLFDRDQALQQALQLFWRQGFAATSVDDLAAAMGLNKPSLYNAFGGKQPLYRAALARFGEQMEAGLASTLLAEADIHQALRKFYGAALDVYYSGPEPLGCMVMCTAAVEAFAHDDVQQDLRSVILQIDGVLRARLEQAKADGQIDTEMNSPITAMLLQAVLHSIAIRARAGLPRRQAEKLVRHAVEQLRSGKSV